MCVWVSVRGRLSFLPSNISAQNLGSNHPAIRDAVTGEASFEVTGEKPLLGGKALCVKLLVD
jgi:hypothetical protein